MKVAAVVLGAIFCFVVIVIFGVLAVFLLVRTTGLSFEDDLVRTVQVAPTAEQGLQLAGFDITPNGDEIYYFSLEPASAIYVQDVATGTSREFFALPGANRSSAVSVVNESEILVLDHQIGDGQDRLHFLSTDGSIQRSVDPALDRSSYCAGLLQDPAAHTFYGYESRGLGLGEEMAILPEIAVHEVDGFLRPTDCNNATTDAISRDIASYRPINQTAFVSMDVVEDDNVLSYGDGETVILSNPRGFMPLANFECERRTNFVVKIDEAGYKSRGRCVFSITGLPSSLRSSDQFFVIEADEIISLEQ